jgi:hypothetical protein
VQGHVDGAGEMPGVPLRGAAHVEDDDRDVRGVLAGPGGREVTEARAPHGRQRGTPGPVPGGAGGSGGGSVDADPDQLALCRGDLLRRLAEQGDRCAPGDQPAEVGGEGSVEAESGRPGRRRAARRPAAGRRRTGRGPGSACAGGRAGRGGRRTRTAGRAAGGLRWRSWRGRRERRSLLGRHDSCGGAGGELAGGGAGRWGAGRWGAGRWGAGRWGAGRWGAGRWGAGRWGAGRWGSTASEDVADEGPSAGAVGDIRFTYA